MSKDDAAQELRVDSLYSARSDAPLVRLTAGAHSWVMPPEKAREVGAWLIQAAEAAYSDAFLVRFMEQRIGVDRPHAALLLREFRQWKELQRRAGQEVEEADQQAWRDQDVPE